MAEIGAHGDDHRCRPRPVPVTAATVHVWLAEDPQTERITAQAREWTDLDFPRGSRGLGWARRELEVPAQTWTKLRRATLTGEQQDKTHRRWWAQAGQEEAR